LSRIIAPTGLVSWASTCTMRSSLLSGEVQTDDPTIGAMVRSVTASTLEVAVDSAPRSLALVSITHWRYLDTQRTSERRAGSRRPAGSARGSAGDTHPRRDCRARPERHAACARKWYVDTRRVAEAEDRSRGRLEGSHRWTSG